MYYSYMNGIGTFYNWDLNIEMQYWNGRECWILASEVTLIAIHGWLSWAIMWSHLHLVQRCSYTDSLHLCSLSENQEFLLEAWTKVEDMQDESMSHPMYLASSEDLLSSNTTISSCSLLWWEVRCILLNMILIVNAHITADSLAEMF